MDNINNFWFPDLDYDIPVSHDPDSKYIKFWKAEMNKFQNGFYIADGQVKIGGWLYWHTVYWNIQLDIMLPNGESFKDAGIPKFRDLEWEIQNDVLDRCVAEKKGCTWIGSRGPGKSFIIASIGGYYYTVYNNNEIVCAAPNDDFNQLLTDKIEYGLSRLPKDSLYKNRVLNDWNDVVQSGLKDEGIRKGSNSKFTIRNYNLGNNPTAASGTRPKVHIIDEQGELPNLIGCLDAGKQCWMNDFGQFAIPLLAGTGGNMNRGKQASLVFLNPKGHNMLEFPDIYEGRKTPIGYFTSVLKARNEYKEEWTLYRYLTEKRGMELKPHPDLERIKILVSNEEKCLKEFVEPLRETAALSDDPDSLTKMIAFYPLVPSEAFTIIGTNYFDTQACIGQQSFLKTENIKGQSVKLERMPDGSVKRTFSDAQEVRSWPAKASEDNTGAIIIFEEPIQDAPDGLYIAGADPYSQDASTTTSIGTLYIYKRMLSVNDTYVDEIVASCNGRPATRTIWHTNAELLMDYYNAKCMPENETATFIQYFDEKNCSYKLADGLQLLKEITPESDVKRTKGLPPTPAMKKYLYSLIAEYIVEPVLVGKDEYDNPIYKKGVIRIKDPMLLEELINFQPDLNVDRIIAFGHALAYAKSLIKFGSPADYQKPVHSEPSTVYKPNKFFPKTGSYFTGKKKSLL